MIKISWKLGEPVELLDQPRKAEAGGEPSAGDAGAAEEVAAKGSLAVFWLSGYGYTYIYILYTYTHL